MRRATVKILLGMAVTLPWIAAAAPARPGLTIRLPDGQVASVVGDERGYRLESQGVSLTVRGSRPARPRTYARAPVRATGHARICVAGVQFPDLPADQSLTAIADGITEELRSYFDEVSRGMLSLQVEQLTADWITARESSAFYGGDGAGIDDRNQPIYELAREVLVAADADADFRVLDDDGDGILEMGEAHFLIIQSGSDQAATGSGDDIWSHRWWIYGSAAGGSETRLDGVLLSEPNLPGEEAGAGYVMVAATDPLGVMAHELLHSFGAPDLYDVSGSGTVPVGPWSVMDIGLWLGTPSGSRPCRPGGYLEWDLDADAETGISGWVTPQYPSDGEHLISYLGGGEVEVVVVPTPIPSECFLLENRARIGTDESLPEAGILIYHLDTSQPTNNTESSPPYRVWLEDPGQRPWKRGAAYSQDDGPDQAAFTPATLPSSQSNRGDSTGIAITAIGPEGAAMSFQLYGTTPVPEVDNLTAWPSPVPTGGTLSVQLPRGSSRRGNLELWDVCGRRLMSRQLYAGTTRVLLPLPAEPQSGALVLVYRTDEALYSAPVVIAP